MDLIFRKENLDPWIFLHILIKIMNKREAQKMKVGATRKSQKEQGYFDGRFVERSEKLQNKYKRKPKHKNKSYDGDEDQI
jgi:hypothetical protein